MKNNQILPENIVRARALRKNQTPEEDLLWRNLKNRKFHNLKFTRQKPLIYQVDAKPRYFIADFYCHSKKLVIELDGMQHEDEANKEYDKWRDSIINGLGLTVLRIKNFECKNIDSVLMKIKGKLDPTE